ncbi:hypothetical protein BJ508DRAFT_224318 [Ascobolus immersus RN42]|uniref:Uncharacterized protein n=1 Tax=Ascobolus immersus RN42 TaxID=1160509 RepID=A0A3N4IAK5_ASCIM|nr:hypothetical protein BJ508DRAFT_224318 [Ascobolus immersus RN42]
MSDPVDIEAIIGSKENIQPRASGRSARALVAALTPTSGPVTPQGVRGVQSVARKAFEKELETAAELDDPLEVWVRYFQWTLDTFPACNTTESGMVHLLERATKAFEKEPQYKNDPRYLKMWIHYIQYYSDAPREHFAYLARHDIGQRLALFYEEFAAYLESTGRRNQAAEIYQTGIENNAKPVQRLTRKYEEFRERLEANPPDPNEPSSPAIPTVRPALASKPFGTSIASTPDPQASRGLPGSAGGSTKPKKNKLAVFSDADAEPEKATRGGGSKGWDSIGTMAERKKENTMEARPWAGETLQQDKAAVKKAPKEKLAVFRDTSKQDRSSSSSSRSHRKRPSIPATFQLPYETYLKPERPDERWHANMLAIQPNPQNVYEEYSPEELRAISRGLYRLDWDRKRQLEAEATRAALQAERAALEERRRQSLERRQRASASPGFKDSFSPVKVAMKMSPEPSKGKVKKLKKNGRPAMDLTKKLGPRGESDDEGDEDEEDEEDSEEEEEEDEEFVSAEEGSGEEDESGPSLGGRRSLDAQEKPAGKLSGHRDSRRSSMKTPMRYDESSEDDAPTPLTDKLGRIIGPPPEDYDPPTHPWEDPKEKENRKLPFMTPITEVTESLPPTTGRNRRTMRTPSRYDSTDGDTFDEDEEEDEAYASPTGSPLPRLKEVIKGRKVLGEKKPLLDSTPVAYSRGPIIAESQCNPCDPNLRKQILENIQPPLASADGFNIYTKRFGKSELIRRHCNKKNAVAASASPLSLSFPAAKAPYTFKKELGKGAFAPVYLVENEIFNDDGSDDTGNEFGLTAGLRALGRSRLEAIKMEYPPSAWEYYIIRTTKRRLGYSRVASSVVTAHEFHMFPDECYLVLDYFSQGTIIDLVNLARNDTSLSTSGQIDEQLVMFLTIELLRTVEALHAKGIIHGDLKADNCLVRFEALPDAAWSSRYYADGSCGWDKKGLALIDFGRGIDMTAFKPTVQFIADWPPDEHDCAEIREMRPWTYQIDYHGIANIIHTLLFGKFIETVVEKDFDALARSGGGVRKRYRVSSGFKRYWQAEIWADCFDVLLNSGAYAKKGGMLPVEQEIRDVRRRMEKWLEGNSERGLGLKTVIKRMEGVLKKRK